MSVTDERIFVEINGEIFKKNTNEMLYDGN